MKMLAKVASIPFFLDTCLLCLMNCIYNSLENSDENISYCIQVQTNGSQKFAVNPPKSYMNGCKAVWSTVAARLSKVLYVHPYACLKFGTILNFIKPS